MSSRLGKRRLAGLAVTLATALLVTTAGRAKAADPLTNSGVTVDQPGAILVFPKVVYKANPTTGEVRDTIIQVANTFNSAVRARCFYVNAQLTNPTQPFHPTLNPRLWQETDFSILLTRQQPTHWVASLGRPVNPGDPLGSGNAGLDPGGVPPVTLGFEGELRCVTVDNSDAALGANYLKGEATLRSSTYDVSNYNAIAIRGGELAPENPTELWLDEIGKDTGLHYNSCPDTLLLDFIAFGEPDPVVSDLGLCTAPADCAVETTLTLVPCSADFENVQGGSAVVNFDITNEFEERLSRDGVPVDCWLDSPLNALGSNAFNAGVLGSITGFARITPASGSGGILGIAEETRSDSAASLGRAAFSLQHEGSRAASEAPDVIVLSAP
ncbi:MAG: hypothetical protein HY699_07120 [Deltaproteobacteria bacterium]|nr:hypothetical protein [Deltaproteobacteria bacterium]